MSGCEKCNICPNDKPWSGSVIEYNNWYKRKINERGITKKGCSLCDKSKRE